MATIIDEILKSKEAEIALAQRRLSLGDIKREAQKAPAVRPLRPAIEAEFGLIGEIKKKSPSMGEMRVENVSAAVEEYERNPLVKAFSILTDRPYFGMDLDSLRAIRNQVSKPILRKDFIIAEYQIYEARAFGADAILLMVSVLKERSVLQRFYDVARELGMNALFEVHDRIEMGQLPADAEICGINSRKFTSGSLFGLNRFALSRWLGRFTKKLGNRVDWSTDLSVFDFVRFLPTPVKVAESGVNASTIRAVKDAGFHCALVGTSLLQDPRGMGGALSDFQVSLGCQQQPR